VDGNIVNKNNSNVMLSRNGAMIIMPMDDVSS
jgi:hypothetical protein